MKNGVSASPVLPELGRFRAAFAQKNWKEALPSALDDAVLRGLARDIRSLENSSLASTDARRPLFLVACIALARARTQVEESVEDGLAAELLSAYQFLLEREIVGRLIQDKSSIDEEAFLAFVDQRIGGREESNAAINYIETAGPTSN